MTDWTPPKAMVEHCAAAAPDWAQMSDTAREFHRERVARAIMQLRPNCTPGNCRYLPRDDYGCICETYADAAIAAYEAALAEEEPSEVEVEAAAARLESWLRPGIGRHYAATAALRAARKARMG